MTEQEEKRKHRSALRALKNIQNVEYDWFCKFLTSLSCTNHKVYLDRKYRSIEYVLLQKVIYKHIKNDPEKNCRIDASFLYAIVEKEFFSACKK